MRLTPIENPRHPMTRLAYWMMKREFGKVAAPLKIIYARKPVLLPLMMLINKTADRGMSLEPELRLLVFDFVDTLNGCTFCDDYRLAIAVQKRIGIEKFAALGEYRTSELYDARERAALTYAEETVRRHDASDETFEDVLEQVQDRDSRDALARELRDAFLSMARPAAEGSVWSRQPLSWDQLSETVRPVRRAVHRPPTPPG